MTLSDIATPALLIDMDALESNLSAMMQRLEHSQLKLRPHFKSTKITEIARMQMRLGAKGITCAKLSEAEVLVKAGIPDVLIANEIIDRQKLRKLAELAKVAVMAVAVDDEQNLRDISQAATEADALIRVLVELDIGMNRCGVRDRDALLHLARLAMSLPGVRFMGIQAYEGHLVHVNDPDARASAYQQSLAMLRSCVDWLEQHGIPVPEISGGGTGTWNLAIDSGLYTELQAGSYIYKDARYSQVAGTEGFASSLFVLSEVIGHTGEFAIVDAGYKSMTVEFGLPVPMGSEGRQVKLSEEHTKIEDPQRVHARGDRIKLLPSHSCTTINLFDSAYGVRKDIVEHFFTVDGRGKSQ